MLKQRSLRLLFITTAFLFLLPLIVFASVKMVADSGEKRPDILTIDIPDVPEEKDMPAVLFKHDLHTQAVDGDCAKCHDQKAGKTIFKFKRLQNEEGASYMDLYHENCVACHAEMKGKEGDKGPLGAECRTCHNADVQMGSSWEKIEFDRSLHYAHEKAKTIKATHKTDTANCSACHHSANMKAKETFYEKGKESACLYCHKADRADMDKGMSTAQEAAHGSCVACHLLMTEKKVETGPLDCAGCHTAKGQEKIKPQTNIPRLDRNQPDQVLLTGWAELGSSDEESKKIVSQYMDPVPFDHKTHEATNESCKVCHHETLNKCASCHTEKGQEKGGFINLGKAMHASDSSQSCIGCHNEKKKAKECAGCHAQLPKKAAKDENCAACHAVDVKHQPSAVLNDETAKADLAKAAMSSRTYKKISLEDVPETVVIKVLEDKYQPSNFPHRMVVESIFKQVEGNTMAKAFHGTDLTMCAGCHHNSPATLTPPKCASCHGAKPDIATGKPGLKGAYHGQCITCHQEMEVKSVLATDCIKCHEKK